MTSGAARLTAAAAVAIGLLAGVAAAVGVVARGDGSSVLVTSARGEVYEMATTGIYANNALAVVAEGVGWDIFTLMAAVPAVLVGAWLTVRGSARGALFTAGMLGYFAYMYLEYSVTWAFGPLFPLFATITAFSVIGLIAVSVLISDQRHHFSDRFPRRSWAVLSVGMASLLTLLWAQRIATGLQAGAPSLNGETTMTVQALDLGLVVPVLIVIAVAAWRRLPIGMVAGAAFGVTFVAMSFAIAAMMVSASIVTGVAQLPPIIVFSVAAASGLLVVARMYASATPVPAAGNPTERTPTPGAELAVHRVAS